MKVFPYQNPVLTLLVKLPAQVHLCEFSLSLCAETLTESKINCRKS